MLSLNNAVIASPHVLYSVGLVIINHSLAQFLATWKKCIWVITKIINVANIVGRNNLGIRLNADFATDIRAPSMFPALDCRIGFKAQT